MLQHVILLTFSPKKCIDFVCSGVIIGPILGGLLADPVASYPKLFGENSVYGGEDGVWWMKHWPYALPNLLSAIFLFWSAVGVVFGLEEVSR